MPLAERTARATWKGDLMSGGGEFTVDSSVGGPHAVSWAARTESPGGKTSPEELIAAAHATCFSMALSNGLAKDNSTLWIADAYQPAIRSGRRRSSTESPTRSQKPLMPGSRRGLRQPAPGKPSTVP